MTGQVQQNTFSPAHTLVASGEPKKGQNLAAMENQSLQLPQPATPRLLWNQLACLNVKAQSFKKRKPPPRSITKHSEFTVKRMLSSLEVPEDEHTKTNLG